MWLCDSYIGSHAFLRQSFVELRQHTEAPRLFELLRIAAVDTKASEVRGVRYSGIDWKLGTISVRSCFTEVYSDPMDTSERHIWSRVRFETPCGSLHTAYGSSQWTCTFFVFSFSNACLHQKCDLDAPLTPYSMIQE